MSQQFVLPLPQRQPPLNFPNRCVSCGKPQETDRALKVERQISDSGSTRQISLTLNVPLCASCKQRDQRMDMLTMGAFVIGGLLAAIVSFLPFLIGGWLLEDFLGTGRSTQTTGFSLVLAACLALLIGIVGGFVFEFVVKLLGAPFFGFALLRYPSMVAQIFTDVSPVLGLTAQLTPDGRMLRLHFANDEVAREFAQLNGQ